MRKRIAIFSLLFLLASSHCRAAITWAVTTNVTCDFLSISNAMMTAVDGTHIIVGAGSCTITNAIAMTSTKSVWLQGSGTNSTTLICPDPFSTLPSIYFTKQSTNYPLVISDFNMVGATNNSNGMLNIGGNPPTTAWKGQFRIFNIKMTNIIGRGISVGYADSFGLIDHCYLEFAPDSKIGSSQPQPISFGGNSQTSFITPNPIGTSNSVYVEDCTIVSRTNKGNGFWDSYEGAQFVVRHSLLSGQATAGTHGYDSGNNSPRSFEVYNNVITNGKAVTPFMEIRGGTGNVFSNVLSGWGTMATLCSFRSCLSDHTSTGHGQLDGSTTNVLDGNIDGTGYPGHQQVGVIQSYFFDNYVAAGVAINYQVMLPMYQWSNSTPDSVSIPLVVQGPYACGWTQTNIIKSGRDFFDDTPAPGYTPFTYPHPLVAAISGGGDTTPPVVTITTPTSASTDTVSTSSYTIGGTASDDVAVSSVTCAMTGATTGSVTITGTTSWTGATATLTPGTTTFTVTATDSSGNTSQDTLAVTYAIVDPPSGSAAALNATRGNIGRVTKAP